ncbi:PREDICTED: putative gustatory receptor 59e [Drosophila arizonae]|uniref:Gustatory receptor n=1 Tax=Drosophila arizonae TaxID=7263 RepID=A0ABM1PJZ6_DROAR|nr:PREDICTED: putative gustatory receptor 59e [Drosophila arizonae]
MSTWLYLLFLCARCLGVSPSNEQVKYPHLVWSLLLLICVWFFTLHRLITMRFYKQVLTIQKLFYFAEYPANMLLTALFSLRIYRSEDFYKRLSLQLERLKAQLFVNPDAIPQLYRGLRNQIMILFCLMLVFHSICALVDSAWLNFDLKLSFASNCAHQLPCAMINFGLLQYILIHRLLCLFYAELNRRLGELQQRPEAIELKLEELRLISVELDGIQAKLLDRFEFALIVNFANSLLSFSYETFNTFRLLELAQLSDWVLYCYRSLWLLQHGSRIWLVLRVNERIIEQKCQLRLLLNQLDASDARLERSINSFLLQLQSNHNQPLALCIELDTLALGGFINALLAIVIFLVQIDLGNKSLKGFV